MKLMQRRVLVLMDDEGREKLGEVNEGDEVQPFGCSWAL